MEPQIAQITTLAVLAFVGVVGVVLFFVGFALDYDSCVGQDTAQICDETYYERWWPVTLEIVTGVGIGLAYFSGKLEEHLIAAMGFLVLSTAVLMESINAAIWSVEFGKESVGQVLHAELAGAGLVLLALMNCAGIILLGLKYHRHEKRSLDWPVGKIVSTVLAGVWVAVGVGLMLGGVIPKEIKCAEMDEHVERQECSYQLRFTWWTIAFESAVGVWALIAVLIGWLDRMAVPIAAFLALVTSNLMDEADIALTSLISAKSVSDDLVAAGVLLLCLVNMVLLIGFAVGGILTSHRQQVNPAAVGDHGLVISVGVTVLPLLLGLGLAVTGVARLNAEYCEKNCEEYFRSSYWSFAFELVVILVICGLAFLKKDALAEVRGIVQVFLVLVSLETMAEVGKMLRIEPKQIGFNTNATNQFPGYTSVGIAAAGYIVVTAMNYVLMLVMGCETLTEMPSEGYEPAP